MWLFWLAAGVAFAIDQWSKHHVFVVLDLQTRELIQVFPPLLELRKGLNTGVNFGLLSDSSNGHRWMLIALTLVLCTALAIWARRSFSRGVEYVAAGLVVGGALGNALDRLLFPGVRDFLNMSCCGIQNPYVFNVADIFIFAGAFGLVLFGGDRDKRKKHS